MDLPSSSLIPYRLTARAVVPRPVPGSVVVIPVFSLTGTKFGVREMEDASQSAAKCQSF
jgi:hypothetical protein